MNTIPPPPMPPSPFGDPTQVRAENRAAAGKGVLFGCGGCALILIAVVVFGAAIFAVVMFSLKQTDAYTEAVSRAKASSALKAELGEPIEAGLMLSGSVNINNGNGHANITVPVSGPKDEASIHAVADKHNGAWKFSTLTATTKKNGLEINLLKAEVDVK